ncbi:hypothetical protein BDR04DRAFT_1096860 [Suillus decipiens]|nr:hypothetical protein BDR04DRAFT_1096860 [Suillus decipiens]
MKAIRYRTIYQDVRTFGACSLGNLKYRFKNFAPGPEKVELYEAALSNALEATFTPKGRKDESAPCPFELQESEFTFGS